MRYPDEYNSSSSTFNKWRRLAICWPGPCELSRLCIECVHLQLNRFLSPLHEGTKRLRERLDPTRDLFRSGSIIKYGDAVREIRGLLDEAQTLIKSQGTAQIEEDLKNAASSIEKALRRAETKPEAEADGDTIVGADDVD